MTSAIELGAADGEFFGGDPGLGRVFEGLGQVEIDGFVNHELVDPEPELPESALMEPNQIYELAA